MKTMKGEAQLSIKVMDSGHGVVGVVENLPIVVESQDESQLKSDIADALVACIGANPKLIQDIISIKIPA